MRFTQSDEKLIEVIEYALANQLALYGVCPDNSSLRSLGRVAYWRLHMQCLFTDAQKNVIYNHFRNRFVHILFNDNNFVGMTQSVNGHVLDRCEIYFYMDQKLED